eukprot:3134255-Rhodomonas_salina.1
MEMLGADLNCERSRGGRAEVRVDKVIACTPPHHAMSEPQPSSLSPRRPPFFLGPGPVHRLCAKTPGHVLCQHRASPSPSAFVSSSSHHVITLHAHLRSSRMGHGVVQS